MDYTKQNIWIIGASSGIGRELAIALSQKGARLILSARRDAELISLNQQIGGGHIIYPLDVADLSQVQEVCTDIANKKLTLDRVIFMSAIYKPASVEEMDLGFMSQMIDVNLKGAIYVTKTILPIFHAQKSGQIVLCGSVAGYTGLPKGQPYSASKAAIINFAESLYTEMPKYIDVKLINPGFVATPMTDKNQFKMPMIITASKAADYIINRLDKNCFEIDFPKKFTLVLRLISILPYKIKLFLTSKL